MYVKITARPLDAVQKGVKPGTIEIAGQCEGGQKVRRHSTHCTYIAYVDCHALISDRFWGMDTSNEVSILREEI